MATKSPTHPTSVLEKIICDADTFHFGTAEFIQTGYLVYKELNLLTGKTPVNWTKDTIEILTAHQFYTAYCREKLNEGKEKNLIHLKSLL